MARLARLCLPGWPHLVIQRVHEGGHLARDEADAQAWLAALAAALPDSGCALHAYRLSDDRFMLLTTPADDDGLSRLVQGLGRRYVSAYNRRHGRGGSLWAGRFRATVLEPESALLDAMLFVEGPEAPGQADGSGAVDCTSRPHHLGQRTDSLITDHALFWQLGNTPFEREAAYARRLEAGLGTDRALALEQAAHRGWVIGSPAFVARLASVTDRPLAPRKRGRPPKVRPPSAEN